VAADFAVAAGAETNGPAAVVAAARDRQRDLLCDARRRGLAASRRPFPFIEKVFADAGYQGPRVATATWIAVEIVRRKPDQIGFAVQPRRWVVERFFAWINRNRRLWKDAEATIASTTAFLYAAAAMVLIRRVTRNS
jgi:transposase